MEEVEGSERSLTERIRRGIAGIFLPNNLARLNELELALGKARRQNEKLASDIGLMKAKQWANLLIGDYNPDEISLDEYAKMMDYDSQVRTGFDLIGMGVLMKPWRIRHPDEKVVATLTAALQRLKQPNIRTIMKELLTAICYGYSVAEIVFESYDRFWVPRQKNGIKVFAPEYIKFFTDEFGNLLKVQQTIGGNEVPLPLNRTLVWTHDYKFGNYYGESILRACYKNWFIKDAMLKFANIAYERFGSPILLGFASTIKDQESVEEAIEHLYAYSQATLLKRDKDDPTAIEVLESKKSEMPFDRYIRYHDEKILQRMLIGQKLFEGGGGVYGPKVPFDIILMRFEDFRLELIAVMNELLQFTAELNWDLKVPPTLEFAPLTSSDVASLRQAIFDAIDRDLLDVEEDQDWIRQELGFPIEQKVREFARTLPGRYLPDPHASWLASGKKTVIVSDKPNEEYQSQEIYIVGEGGIYGTMVQGSCEGPFARDFQQKYLELHQISSSEWDDRWTGNQFWIWRPKILKRFDSPLRFTLPPAADVYLKKVVPEGVHDRREE